MDPRYPIGNFAMPAQVSPARRQQAIEEIAATPSKMRAAVKGLSDSQLDTLKPYNEAAWAELADAKTAPIEASQTLLDSVHTRWDRLWRSLKPEHFARTLVHPEHGERTVDWLLFLYEWHGKHHAAHITELRKQKSW